MHVNFTTIKHPPHYKHSVSTNPTVYTFYLLTMFLKVFVLVVSVTENLLIRLLVFFLNINWLYTKAKFWP